MIIEIKNGNIFNSECDIITNAVNCIGIMGGGLAKQFADKYPDMEQEYKLCCKQKILSIGNPTYHFTGIKNDQRIICNFPTMLYPGSIAKKEDIKLGLHKLYNDITKNKSSIVYNKSIALCALGCGIGRFSYIELKNLILNIFTDYNNTVEIYKPLSCRDYENAIQF